MFDSGSTQKNSFFLRIIISGVLFVRTSIKYVKESYSNVGLTIWLSFGEMVMKTAGNDHYLIVFDHKEKRA